MNGESPRLTSINQRVVNAAREVGQDSQRVRRRVAFQRLLARMASSGWVLKGGFCLEARLPGEARATKDIDFVRRGSWSDEDALLDEFDDLFAVGRFDDGFEFDAISAKVLRAPEDPASAWRVRVECRIERRLFENLVLDVVTQYEEVADAVEPLLVPAPVEAPGIGAVEVSAVDVYQHAAEKFHAMGRVYAGDRPSSRVKDLVDLALLSEAGLLTDEERLADRIRVVHRLRDGAPPPAHLPTPPGDWASGYARLVAELSLAYDSAEDAFGRVHALYLSALSKGPRS